MMDRILIQLANQYVGFGGILSVLLALIHIIKGRTFKNVVLFLIFLSMGVFLVKGLVLINQMGTRFSHFFSIEIFFIFVIGPSLYIYFNLLLWGERVGKKTLSFHYIPSILFLVFYLIHSVYLMYSGDSLDDLGPAFHSKYDSIYILSTFITVGYMIVVIVKFIRLFQGNFSRYPWTIHLILLMALGLFGVNLHLAIDLRFLFSLENAFVELYVPALCALSSTVIYAFFISQIYPITFNIISETFQKVRYQNSTLSRIDPEDLKSKLEILMNSEKVFLEENLTLAKLASKLQVKPHQLSEFLNNHLRKSFFHYVNKLRIEEARLRLLEAEETSVIKTAFESGFNSLSVFNTSFKREFGMTPSQYKKKFGKQKSDS
ncbi:AraC family transcriptional regulator [Leptospira gomenensis]|uniref:AraC family transcriptional regulator n=1 Tax=Leptospira gomenensis TaxID=2484974 RepID=A0A5F1YHS3_9LEPT|nr:helix-turn-helix domain-containing protein [Leptospira gomenensis]TGK39205.1 AraC family transcriptional regulator [Leptospira gomenensis]TGK44254.1 AraC family transcriptional regulator [Leptospira gomenensis]TGK45076.1 AraC family transcriptional regulator [Leptospira gomenensis]TGK65116.1 AraC family transcriptional regulator [Leptospira gomenensis]